MTAPQHTPGPWVARTSNSERYSLEVNAAGRWPYNCIARIPEMFGQDCKTPGAHVANARLIEAAPELLALLIESQQSIGGDWRERRDAAVAKATTIGNPPPC